LDIEKNGNIEHFAPQEQI